MSASGVRSLVRLLTAPSTLASSSQSARPLFRAHIPVLRNLHTLPTSYVSRRLAAVQPSRRLNSTAAASPPASSSSADPSAPASESNPALQLGAPSDPTAGPQKIGQIEPRLSVCITFTCTANDCGHRSSHEFSKRAYTKGIVLVQCPECKSRHLIADHIGWFKEATENGKMATIEDLMRLKGEKVQRGRVNMEGDIEYDPE